MSARSKILVVARVLLGLAFTVFGLNFFLHFLPQPPPPPEAGVFLGALFAGKIFSIIKPIEIAAGLALLGNRFVPLALLLIAPVLVNIVAFHAFLATSGLVLASVLVALELHLAWVNRSAYRPLFVARRPR